MKLYYYQNREGNFGDDLNPYLWPQLLPRFMERQPDTVFVGIGTILMGRFFSEYSTNKLIVFGTGSRGFYPNARWTPDSHVAFVRGPLSALALNLPATKVVTDSAYAITLLKSHAAQSHGSDVGFIPHYSTMRKSSQLPRAAADAGISFINPTAPVDSVLNNMSKCKHIICEAMHGAILADALRIPWTRVAIEATRYESDLVHHFKWNDWMLSINCVTEPVFMPFPPTTTTRMSRLLGIPNKLRWRASITESLIKLKDQHRARLSSDVVFKDVTTRIAAELENVNKLLVE